MKNEIVCSNCSTKNPYTAYTCSNCRYFLRDKVANINLWSLFWQMMESPKKAFNQVVFSEHKNFLIVLLILLSFKTLLNSLVFKTGLGINPDVFSNILNNLWLVPAYFIAYMLLTAFILNSLNNFLGLKGKFINSLSVLTFSLWPLLFSFSAFTIIEYSLFGEYFFTFDPSPLDIKPTATYFIWGLEGFFVFVSMVYTIMGINSLTKNKLYSIVAGVVFTAGLIASQIFLPLFPFN